MISFNPINELYEAFMLHCLMVNQRVFSSLKNKHFKFFENNFIKQGVHCAQ